MPDEMEAEKNRKMLVSQAGTIEILQTNVRDLQEQLNKAHKRIGELTYQECFCGLADEPVMATEEI